METTRLPVVFVPHGGGPWPFVDLGFPKHEVDSLADHLRGLRLRPYGEIRAILVISAHWEEHNPTLMTAAEPPLLYDYYGFPDEAYHLSWGAKGSPAIATEVRDVLREGGVHVEENSQRGFDHGTFVPLMLAWPHGEIPIVQLSLQRDLQPAVHLTLGQALAPLRERGILIIGTGMTFHNMRAMRQVGGKELALEFHAWLKSTLALPEAERNAALAQWTQAPGARFAHPREEHLLPLMVVAGAAGSDLGDVDYDGTIAGWPHLGVSFGGA